MIREKKSLNTPSHPLSPQAASYFNTQRNQTRELVKAVNSEQKFLYNALKDKIKNYYHKAPKEFSNLTDNSKKFTANQESV